MSSCFWLVLSLKKYRRVYEPQDQLSSLHVFLSVIPHLPLNWLHLCSLSCPSLPSLKDAVVIHSGPDLPLLFVLQCWYLCPLWPVNSCMQKQILKQLSLGVNWRYAGACDFERTPVKTINENLLHMEKTIPIQQQRQNFLKSGRSVQGEWNI